MIVPSNIKEVKDTHNLYLIMFRALNEAIQSPELQDSFSAVEVYDAMVDLDWDTVAKALNSYKAGALSELYKLCDKYHVSSDKLREFSHTVLTPALVSGIKELIYKPRKHRNYRTYRTLGEKGALWYKLNQLSSLDYDLNP